MDTTDSSKETKQNHFLNTIQSKIAEWLPIFHYRLMY